MTGQLGELVRMFVRLGVTAFGGPAAHIAMMHREVVVQRGWMTDQHFVDLIGATNLVPGPNSTEMTMHVGNHRAGWRGLLTAGASFIIPAALIVGVFAALYVEYGSTPTGEGILYGVTPVITAVVGVALFGLGRKVMTSVFPVVVAIAVAGLYLGGIDELALLFGGGLVFFLVGTGISRRGSGLAMIPFLQLGGEPSIELPRLLGLFLKIGSVLYGSGYVLLAFLHGDFVESGLLTDAQLLDAVAVGQFTPGPVFTTATFVGYVLAGFPGAVVATVGIFTPAFFFVWVLGKVLPRIREREWSSNLLDGVNASALGLMGGVLVQLVGDALVDPLTIALGVVALWLLLRTSVNSAWLVVAGGVIGVVASL